MLSLIGWIEPEPQSKCGVGVSVNKIQKASTERVQSKVGMESASPGEHGRYMNRNKQQTFIIQLS